MFSCCWSLVSQVRDFCRGSNRGATFIVDIVENLGANGGMEFMCMIV